MASDIQKGAYAQVVLPLGATIAISLRFWLRTKFGHKLRWDDFIMLAAVPMAWADWALWAWWGTVRTMINTQSYAGLSTGDRESFWKGWFAVSTIYTASSFAVKASILLFFLRAFGTTRTAKSILGIMLGLNVVYFVMRFIPNFLNCRPFSTFWKNRMACGNSHFWHEFYIIMESIGLILELAILVFPMPYVLLLRQPLRTRLAICSVFALGLATCLAAAMRIYIINNQLFVLQSLGIDAPTSNIFIATNIELNLGIITGCLATIRSPLSQQAGIWLAKWRRITAHSSTATVDEANITDASAKAGLVELRVTEIRGDLETQVDSAFVKEADDDDISPTTPHR